MTRLRRPTHEVTDAAVWLSELMNEDRQLRIIPDELRARAARLYDEVRHVTRSQREKD
jgi:hypothetical protein